jgi:hypothetical protein
LVNWVCVEQNLFRPLDSGLYFTYTWTYLSDIFPAFGIYQ